MDVDDIGSGIGREDRVGRYLGGGLPNRRQKNRKSIGAGNPHLPLLLFAFTRRAPFEERRRDDNRPPLCERLPEIRLLGHCLGAGIDGRLEIFVLRPMREVAPAHWLDLPRRFALGAEEDRHGVRGANVERANFRDLIDDLRADPLREPREARERSEIRLVTAAHPFTMRSEAAKTRGARAKALPTARRVQAPLPNGTSLPRSIEDKA